MPITVFDVKGVPGHRRERIEAAVVRGGKHANGAFETVGPCDEQTESTPERIGSDPGFVRDARLARKLGDATSLSRVGRA